MNLVNTFLTAFRGLVANKLRTVLTALGIIIGVASVIATLALGNGARAAVDANFRFLGADQIQINAEYKMDKGEMALAGKKLTYEDGLLMAKSASLIKRVEMSVNGFGKVRRGRISLDMTVGGVTADALTDVVSERQIQPVNWPQGQPLTAQAFIGQGRFFTPAEVLGKAEVCVLGHQTAQELFEGDDPLGETIWVNRKPCEVIGVIAELETTDPTQRDKQKLNESLFMPISVAIYNLYEEEPSVIITAYVSDPARMDEAKAQAAAYLRQRHAVEKDEQGDYQDDFNIMTKKDLLGAQQEAASTFALLLTALAIVSLVVGGIGIMNVMLVSVTERTREIGVRLAVGARRADIVAQFLAEAVLLSAAGGVLGIAVGTLTIPAAAALNQGMALLDPRSIPLAFSVALLTGVAFGLYPAVRAARLDPIEALRYE